MTAEIIAFTIKAEAVGKARPRFTRFGHVYTPKKTADFERLVKADARRIIGSRSAYGRDIAIGLTLNFFFAPPKSWSNAKQKRSYGKPKTTKCDLDNLVKSVLDAFNGVIYEDDANITDLTATKRYAPENSIEITIKAEQVSL